MSQSAVAAASSIHTSVLTSHFELTTLCPAWFDSCTLKQQNGQMNYTVYENIQIKYFRPMFVHCP